MKLWMILYIFGQVHGTAGPLPYGMEECMARAAYRSMFFNYRAEQQRQSLNGRPLYHGDIVVSCEYRDEAPELDEGALP